MARDYKNTRTSGGSGGLSASGGFAIGLLLGLCVAAGVYLYDHRLGAQFASDAPLSNEQPPKSAGGPTPESAQADTQFDFYDVLPNMEVEVTHDKSTAAANGSAAGAIDAPGSYILQVGSYRNFADADRLKAKLALQGVAASIQKVNIDSDTWHRVRIGPLSNLNKLEETRRKLREVQIDAMVMKQR